MNRIAPLDPVHTTGPAREIFDRVQSQLGTVPNLFRVLGNAPAALDGYFQFSGSLAQGTLNARIREQIALAVAEGNLCIYCLSAHAFLGAKAGLSEKDILDARRATAGSDKTDALLKLARTIVVQRGEISDDAIQRARSSGISDSEIIEVVANVALNIFTNYVNHVAQTAVDLPEVKPEALVDSTGTASSECACSH
jgi:uncharacterized peroxidase-related enzyme